MYKRYATPTGVLPLVRQVEAPMHGATYVAVDVPPIQNTHLSNFPLEQYC